MVVGSLLLRLKNGVHRTGERETMRASLLPLLVFAGACPPNVPGYQGERMDQYFVFDEVDGERSWEFVSLDTSLAYLLLGDLVDETEDINDGQTRIHSIRYTRDCLGADPLCEDNSYDRTLLLSFDNVNGALFHGYQFDGEDEFRYENPVVLVTTHVNQDDVNTTETDGLTISSSFVGFEECPNQWNVDWPDCTHFLIEVEGGSTPLAGDWWVNVGFNIVAFDIEADSERWELKSAEY